MRNAIITFLVGLTMTIIARVLWIRGNPEETLLRAILTFILDIITLEVSVFFGFFSSYRSWAIFLTLLGFILMLGSGLYMVGILKTY